MGQKVDGGKAIHHFYPTLLNLCVFNNWKKYLNRKNHYVAPSIQELGHFVAKSHAEKPIAIIMLLDI